MYVRILEGAEKKARMRAGWTPGEVVLMSDATGKKYIDAEAVEALSEDEAAAFKGEASQARQAAEDQRLAEHRERYLAWCKKHRIEPDTAVDEWDWNDDVSDS